MDAAKAKEVAANAAAAGQKAVQDILAHPSVQPHVQKILSCPKVQAVIQDPRIHEAYTKLSDPAVQRHFLADISAVVKGELPLRDALGDLKKVMTEEHVTAAQAVPADK
jgi:hypothetical protein